VKRLIIVLGALGLAGAGMWAVTANHVILIGHQATSRTEVRTIRTYTATELALLLRHDRRAWAGRTVWVRGVLEGLGVTCGVLCGPSSVQWWIYTPTTHAGGPQPLTLRAGPRAFPARDRDRILSYHIRVLPTFQCSPATVDSGSCPDAALLVDRKMRTRLGSTSLS